VPTLFRRKSTATVIEPDSATEGPAAEAHATKSYTPSKRERGVVTPKRTGTTPRRVTAPPANRREAAAQSREQRAKQRREDRDAMMRGEEHALLSRDRGPEKAIVRDVVDSRRNIGTYFFGAIFLIMILTFVSVQLALYGNAVFALLLVVVVIDSVLLSRRIKRTVLAKLPKATPRWGSLYRYGAFRAMTFRGMRVPRPRLKPGEAL
jgi:hypothetical protein